MVEGNITNQYPLTKIRNYYRMGDGILDGYPIIQDQTSPNLAHIPTTNLITYSEDFSNAIWLNVSFGTGVDPVITSNYTTSPDGTNNASRIIFDRGSVGASNASMLRTNITGLTNPHSSSISFYAKSNTASNYTLIWYNESFGSEEIIITPTWTRYTLSSSSLLNTNDRFQFGLWDFVGTTSSTYADVSVWAAQLEEQSQATAYIKSDGIAAVRKSSTTNLVTYSEDLTELINATNGSGSQTTVTINYALSPDGTQNAGRLQGTSESSGYALRGFSLNTSSAETYTQSVYLKSNTGSNQNIVFYGRNTPSDSYTVIATNEWQRFEVTGSSTTNYFAYFGLRPDYGSDSTCDILVYGFQIEQQTQAETYAKTTGLPVTIDLFTENNYGTMTNMSSSDIIEDTPNN